MGRGIITSALCFIRNGQSVSFQRCLTPEDIRYLLLYWDKVVIPATNLIYISIPDEPELVGSGIISRPIGQFSGSFGGDIAKAVMLTEASIAKQLIEHDKSTEWIIHKMNGGFEFQDKGMVRKQAILVDLVNALPVPKQTVAIPDILEFKERRHDELMRVHKAIDDFYTKISSSPDVDMSTRLAIDELSQSLLGINAVTSEKWKSTTKYDISAELNINGKDLVQAATLGAVGDSLLNYSNIPVFMLAGMVASCIKVSCKFTKSFEPARDKRIISYIAEAHNEMLL